MQGIIYTRVSSDEQVKGTSLEFQEELCRKYCAQNGIEVLELFREEGASAKTADRAELLRALEYCRKHRGRIQAFVVAKVDRFARNTEDHFFVRKRLLDYGVTLHSVTEPIGNSPTGKFVETVLAASSEFDNAIRKQRCTDGMFSRLKQGLWPWQPPIGYRCMGFKKRGEKKTEPDPPDPQIFPLIQQALREYARELIRSPGEFARVLNGRGFDKASGRPVAPQLADRILGRYLPFYAGLLVNPWTGGVERGRHVPMISEDEWHRIRDLRSGKSRPVRRDRQNPLFPLRRVILCGSCGRRLTGGVSRGNGGRYPYYHCANRRCAEYGKSITKATLEGEFGNYIRAITPKEGPLRVFRAAVLELTRDERKAREAESVERHKACEQLVERRRRILEMREDGSYTHELFQERLADVERQLTVVRTPLGKSGAQVVELREALDGVLTFTRDLTASWSGLSPALRPRFQQLVFPAGISYDRGRGFRTAKLGLIFELLRQSDGDESRLVDLMRLSWNQIVEEIASFRELQQGQLLAA